MMMMMMMMSVKQSVGENASIAVSLEEKFVSVGWADRRVDFRRAPRDTSSRASHADGVSTMSFIYGHNENAMPRYAPVHRIRARVPFPRASSPDETTRFVRTPRWPISF